MRRNKHCIHLWIGFFVNMLIVVFYVLDAEAGTVTAQRAKLTGRVSVKGAKANDPDKKVEQSTVKGGTVFVDTGSKITTDGSGDGTVEISNHASGRLLVGHNVRVICAGGVICGPATVKKSSSWFASFMPGIQQSVNIEVAQSNFGDDGLELLETWEVGSVWSLLLNPLEASWVDTGFATISDTQGDLAANIIGITSDAISFQILSDLTPLSANSLFIDGVDLDVLAGVQTLNPMYSLTGNTSAYLDGDLLLSQSLSGGQVSAPSINAVPEPASVLLLGLGMLGVFGLRKRSQM